MEEWMHVLLFIVLIAQVKLLQELGASSILAEAVGHVEHILY